MHTFSYKALELAFRKYSAIEFDLMKDCPSTSEYYRTIKDFECSGHWLFITQFTQEEILQDENGEIICPDLLLLVDDGQHMVWCYCLDEFDEDSFHYIGE